MKVGKGGEQYK